MDGGSTPNSEAEQVATEAVPELSSSFNRNRQVSKGVIGVIVLVVVVLLIAINGGFSSANNNDNKVKHHYTIADHLGAPPELPKRAPSTAEEDDKTQSSLIHTGQITEPPSSPHFSVISKVGNQPQTWTPEQRKQLDKILIINRNSQLPKNATLATPTASEGTDKFQQQLQATKLTGSVASRIIDPNLFITKGAFLDCILETAISSDVAGMTRCQLSRDIYSTNGKVLLLEKGSHIVGQYQSGLQQGVARIFVLWNRIETPNGVIIDLDSPGTDTLGRSGNSGYIDGHFKQRFGSAILLSMIGDVGQYAASKANSGNKNQIQFGDTIGSSKDLASIALQDSIRIKPTLLKNQGEHINVFVARDLDFRSVYDLQLSH
ncbi:type IV secretion system protein VirB10 [Shewanella sp. 202IG2-18]|uniref:type IV secretion system protein VirB10 n=1 Tax=Parashewanella hymeniacidonis TaxID=2807618 RepID=UPI0019610F40|nr:type IV secretion system protein VirB10 [Parashewanella hymeniacidonis]MBM7072895.1 type IV secretion system protein VirB10 [Parashewanella hymeniacidonis]